MNVLAFFAHPDDETMLAGGTLALLASNGASVHYLCATRGEGGELGEPPLCSRAELGKVREQEMVCAVQALGGRSLTFLDYIDPVVGPDDQLYPYTHDVTFLAGQVATTICQFQAEVVISHGSNGEYGHPAHILTNQAARVAVESLHKERLAGCAPALYTVGASFPAHPRPRLANPDDPADIILDVSAVIEAKTQAALCHRTQHALFVRRPSKEAGRNLSVPEVILRLESLRRAYPPIEGSNEDVLAAMLKPWLIEG